ncbi:hypothetical protein FZEAL_2321 [Fusarium zealandicum]|uniref:Fungal N-terminal domain-containing protein n=1 Tax=Fusarium zealandicum TaxID=1053134 RepID=A0A8H4UR18_9HYPO|nr:hypothetical protein FZEAL_2321 [Fusarium zealandicum]
MDPLSILAGVAGIATAGAALANVLFKLIKTARHRPGEIQSIAMDISILNSALEHLHDILTHGSSFAKPSLLQCVSEVVKNIKTTQSEIYQLISEQSFFGRFKWATAAKGLLSDIEKHKVAITLQTSILSAAILVKSTAAANTATRGRPENRFRILAESLIQAGQASLESDNTPASIPEPPRERAPSPPVRTKKRLPSPVRQSEIPGHVHSEDLFGRSSRASPPAQNLSVPGRLPDDQPSSAAANQGSPMKEGSEDPYSVFVQNSRAPPGPDNRFQNTTPEDESQFDRRTVYEDEESQTSAQQRNGRDYLKVANFGHHFRLRGDAATFLYKLVFQDGTGANIRTPDHDDIYEASINGSSMREESEFGGPVRYASRPTHRNPTSQEPAKVVDQLLLEWTSLSQSEVEQGSSKSPEEERGSTREQYSYTDSSDTEWEDSDTKEETTLPQPFVRTRRREPLNSQNQRRVLRPTRTDTPQTEDPANKPFSSLNQTPKDYFVPCTYPTYNQDMPYFTPPERQASGHFPTQNWGQGVPFQQPPGFQPDQTNGPTQYGQYWPQTPAPATEVPSQAKPSFQKPGIIVLPQADGADSEAGPKTPELDARYTGLEIMRQSEEAIWNSEKFIAKTGMTGKAIMAALVGDRSARNAHGLDLAHTLMRGQDTKLVYVRGNDLGETWFINEQPIFIQFYHCGYLPQFFPAKETEGVAMKREYVAVGDEWASFEALSQLGLSTKGREEGRVLLDPSVTWSMVKELAITTLQLRCMRQRRQFTPTFYNSIAMFRNTHGGAEIEMLSTLYKKESQDTIKAPPEETVQEAETLPAEEGIRVFDFEVNNWNEKPEEAPIPEENQSAVETRHDTPEICVTSSTTAQEVTPSATPDQDDARSDYSSKTRFSQFFQRYKPGKKHSRLGSMSKRYGSSTASGERSEEVVWRDDVDKRAPPTPSDSGIGSSVS